MKTMVTDTARVMLMLLTLVAVGGCGDDLLNDGVGGSADDGRSSATEASSGTVAGYAIVETDQIGCYDDMGELGTCPEADEAFYRQDGQYIGHEPSYTDNGDGTVTDNVTGLMWQQSPDTDGDGDIDAADKLTYDAEVETVPHVPLSHPFVERLIGTIRREHFDQVFFWNAVDLERELNQFRTYFNEQRTHASLAGNTPAEIAGCPPVKPASLDHFRWQEHCGGLVQLPVAA